MPTSKPVKHIYIHSSSNKLPEEVNLKLILVKPSSSNYGDIGHYNDDSIVGSMSHDQSASAYPPLSGYKRSKINAQLHFVRYKTPLSSKWDKNGFFRKKATTFHFLISKRSSEASKEKEKIV